MVMAAWFSNKDNADTWQRGSRTRITLTHGSVVLADNRYSVGDSIFLIRHRDDADTHPAIFQYSVACNELVFDNKRHATQRTSHTCKPILEAIRRHRRPRHRRGAHRPARRPLARWQTVSYRRDSGAWGVRPSSPWGEDGSVFRALRQADHVSVPRAHRAQGRFRLYP